MPSTTHTLSTGREHAFEGEHLYRVTVRRGEVEPEVAAMLRGRGRDVPGGGGEETIEVAAPREGLATTRAMAVTTLEFNGHRAEYDVEVIA